MKVTVQTAVATLRRLRLQLQQQVMPVQTHLHVLCAHAAAAGTSEQLEAGATGSAVHAILQDLVILFPALRGCVYAALELFQAARMHVVTMRTTCQVTFKPRSNVFSEFAMRSEPS
jgi:hypothetical protein